MIELFVLADVAGWDFLGEIITNIKFEFNRVAQLLIESYGYWQLESPDKIAKEGQEDRNLKLIMLRIVLLIVFSIFSTVLGYLWYRSRRLSQKLTKSIENPQKLWAREASGWQEDIYNLRGNDSIPILTIANFKGGSGKTMIAAHLAAYYDRIGAKVLLIDFDAHGSLSKLVTHRSDRSNKKGGSSYLLERQEELSVFEPVKLTKFNNSYLYEAGADLSRSENSVLLKWIVGQKIKASPSYRSLDKKGLFSRIKDKMYFIAEFFNLSKRMRNFLWQWWFRGSLDVRFNTFNYLMDSSIQTKNKIKERSGEEYFGGYDIIIIDTPAHLTPAFVNALCATTHLLIPTQADGVSSATTIESCEIFETLKKSLKLKYTTLGIVPTLIAEREYRNREKEALKELNGSLPASFKNGILKDMVSSLRGALKEEIFEALEQEPLGGASVWSRQKIMNKVNLLGGDGQSLEYFDFDESSGEYQMFARLAGRIISEIDKAEMSDIKSLHEKSMKEIEESSVNIVSSGDKLDIPKASLTELNFPVAAVG